MRAFHEIREYASGLEVWHGIYDNISIIAHWHTEIELVFVREGRCVMHVNSRRTGAAKGDLIIIRSGDIHYCDVHSPDLRLEFLIFSPEVLKSSMRGIPPAAGFLPAKLMSGAGLSRDWDVLMRCIDEELAAQGMYYSECVRLMITAFYCRLLRKLPVPDFQAVRGNRLCGVLKSA